MCMLHRFSEYPQDSPIVASGHPRLPEWQARKSWQETMKAQGGSSSSVPGQVSKQAAEAVHHGQPLLKSEAKDKSPPSSPASVAIVSGTQRYCNIDNSRKCPVRALATSTV